MTEQRRKLGETYGGQAVMEGVLMRGKYNAAIAVRRPDGEIVVKEEVLSGLYRGPLSKVPFLRGLPMLWDALGLGMKALFYSAELMGQAEDPNFKLDGGMGLATGAASLLFGIALFMILPSLAAGGMSLGGAVQFNFAEGALRLLVLIGYIVAISRSREIRRVFAYHGAEHKTINAYEDGAPLTVEAVRGYSRQHPRCGTAFLLLVALISVLVLLPFGKPPLPIRIVSRLLMMPVISGISYEVLRFTGKHSSNPLIKLIIAPNLALQRLTTREPDDEMLEVSIRALETVLVGEEAAIQATEMAQPAAVNV